ncbi:MAG TPA: hypothetical protein VMU40_22320 [Steroidobacteraceae bacterium]|nr:hypothetical protein [Steroidobacteraceae bacterium]
MTEKQRRAREALEAARGEGVSLSDYAKAHGLPIRELYDAVAALRRKGVLAKTGRAPRSKFVEVRVGPERTVGGIVCRFVHGGVVIECTQWPPPGWVAALVRPAADAAA